MRSKLIYLVILLLLASSKAYASEKDLSFGIGAGALYSGLGINIGVQGENDFRYIAAGCVAVGYSSVSGWISACGVGVGWIWTDIFSKLSNKHGIGFYLGPVGSTRENLDRETVYGAGITYDYFFKGINSSGWNLGVTPAIGRHNGDAKGYLLLQVGYQF